MTLTTIYLTLITPTITNHHLFDLHHSTQPSLITPPTTGGLHPDETFETIITSLKIGYRLFDLAREYNNEQTFSAVLEAAKTDDTLPMRDELFLESKVMILILPTYSTLITLYLPLTYPILTSHPRLSIFTSHPHLSIRFGLQN